MVLQFAEAAVLVVREVDLDLIRRAAARPPLPRVRKDSQGTTRRRSFGEIQSMRRANELEPTPALP